MNGGGFAAVIKTVGVIGLFRRAFGRYMGRSTGDKVLSGLAQHSCKHRFLME